MRIRVRALFGVASAVAVVGMMLGSVTPARACLCMTHTAAEYVEMADVILIGRLVRHETESKLVREGNVTYDMRRHEATMDVERYLKGSGPAEVSVYDDICLPGIGKDIPGPYLVFVNFYDGPQTGLCYGSGQIAPTQPFIDDFIPSLGDTQQLTGSGTPPDDRLSELRPPDTTQFPVLTAVALATLGPMAFLVGAAFLWRRGV